MKAHIWFCDLALCFALCCLQNSLCYLIKLHSLSKKFLAGNLMLKNEIMHFI